MRFGFMKKAIALLLAVVLVVGLLPVTALEAHAAEATEATETAQVASGTCGDDLTWMLDGDGMLTISGTGEMTEFPWFDYVPWYRYRDSITSAVIADGVTSIGSYAFYECANLENITIGNGVASLGFLVFRNNSALTGVWVSGGNAHYSSDENGVLFNKDKTLLIQFPGGFSGTYEIPSGVETIGEQAFLKCKNLKQVIMSGSVITVESRAFMNCTALESVTFGENVTTIGDSAFYGCAALESIAFANNLTTIGSQAFYNCSGLKQVTFGDGMTTIGDYAFVGCGSVEGFSIGSKVTSIGAEAFTVAVWVSEDNTCYSSDAYGVLFNKEKTELILAPGNLSGEYEIPTTVTAIGDAAFKNCRNVEVVIIPIGVTAIGDYALYFCDALRIVHYSGTEAQWATVSIGSNNTSMDKAVIHCSDTVPEIVYSGSCGTKTGWTLDDIGTLTISGTGGMEDYTEYGIRPWDDYTSLIRFIVIEDGVTSIGSYAFRYCKKAKSVTIGNSVTNIMAGAFQGCSSLETLDVPDSVSFIWQYAFQNCTGLESANLGSGVSTIMYRIFYGCSSLSGVWVDEDNSHYSSDEHGVLYDYDKINLVYCPKAYTGEYEIPDGVENIYNSAFMDCVGLTGITIPAGVTTIYPYAFENCTGLTDVYYDGTAAQWAAISIQEYNDYLLNATLHALEEEPALGIVTQPADQLVPNGETAQFTVTATGVVSYRWQYRSANSNTWKNTSLTGYNTDTLSVTMTPTRNNYQYRCKLTGDDGTVIYTDPAKFVMDANVSIVTQPADQTTLEGSYAYFTVEATGILSYRWYYRQNEEDSWHATTMSGYVTDTLKVAVTARRDGYQYRCKMKGEDGIYVYTEPATLNVTPCIITQPTTQAAVVGETARFTVEAENISSYQWMYRRSAENAWGNTGLTGNKTATLEVGATAGRYGYQYMCKLTNTDGSSLYTNVVTLYLCPIVTLQPADQTVALGDTAVFTAAADYADSYQWQYCRAGADSWSNTSATGNKTDTLSVTVKASNNGNRYRCKITDAYGNVSYSDPATLEVGIGITAQPENTAGALNASVQFCVTATGLDLTYQWQYSKNSGTSWSSTSATGNKTATLTVDVLVGRNGYQYRCKITDSNGNVSYSDPATLYLIPTVTAQPVDQSAVIGETVKFPITAVGVETYQWQLSKDSGTTWGATSMTGNTTDTLSVEVTAGRNGYQYRCKLTGQDGSVTYTDAACLYVLTTVTAQPVDKTAAVGETAKFTVTAAGAGLTYQWQYSSNGGSTWSKTTMTGYATKTLSVSVTAARDGYQYRCKITDANGNVTYTDPATLTVS